MKKYYINIKHTLFCHVHDNFVSRYIDKLRLGILSWDSFLIPFYIYWCLSLLISSTCSERLLLPLLLDGYKSDSRHHWDTLDAFATKAICHWIFEISVYYKKNKNMISCISHLLNPSFYLVYILFIFLPRMLFDISIFIYVLCYGFLKN
jgi:hypothetical protein